jgi:Uri superfamily endonuclease
VTDDPGVYQLHLLVPKPARLRIGKLGTFLFPAGPYIYTGSALSGLGRRLARHQRQEKRLHWHIDYLLRHARIERITVEPTQDRRECALNRESMEQPGAQVIVRGFGSSDCRCPAHLVYLGAGTPARFARLARVEARGGRQAIDGEDR